MSNNKYREKDQKSLCNPVVSIVTIVLNDVHKIEDTIRSVQQQTYANIEYIIIDGGSTDGTLNVIKDYDTEIDNWITEDDGGIYEAMNKGLSICNGDFALMLNSGDLLYNKKSIEKIISRVEDLNEPFFGIAEVQSTYSSFLKPSKDIDLHKWLVGNLPIHQAIFVPQKYMNLRYNTEFNIAGDYDYIYRLFAVSNPQFVPVIVAKFKLGGISSRYGSFNHFKKHLSEHFSIIEKYQSNKSARKIYVFFAFSLKYIIGLIFNDKYYYKLVRNGVKIKKLFS